MKIDINKNTIIIEANNLLKRYQTSQLYFYGYFKSEDILFLKSQNLKTDILKTINYLDQENIKYDAS
ncbi:MAG: hypothetical protein C0596_02780 [Marinilabiliales bacterium]|nr:MAG: hypothetical protein C0596_02780 [Marinilabiliales bacterium]